MIQPVPNTAAAHSQAIPIEHLHTRAQIRTRNGFEEQGLRELAESIKRHGILQPLIVTPAGEEAAGFWVVAGERRLLAASLAGLRELPAVVVHEEAKELAAIQAVENLQREDLALSDVAAGLKALADVHGSWRAVAKAIGKSPAWVSKRRAMTRLRPIARATMNEGITNDPEVLLTLNQIEQLDAGQAAFLAEGLQLKTETRESLRLELVKLKHGKKPAKDGEGEGADEEGEEREGDGEPEGEGQDGETTYPVRLTLEAMETLRQCVERAQNGPMDEGWHRRAHALIPILTAIRKAKKA